MQFRGESSGEHQFVWRNGYHTFLSKFSFLPSGHVLKCQGRALHVDCGRQEDILRDEILTSKEEISRWVTHVQNFSRAKYCYPKLSSEYLFMCFIQLLQTAIMLGYIKFLTGVLTSKTTFYNDQPRNSFLKKTLFTIVSYSFQKNRNNAQYALSHQKCLLLYV